MLNRMTEEQIVQNFEACYYDYQKSTSGDNSVSTMESATPAAAHSLNECDKTKEINSLTNTTLDVKDTPSQETEHQANDVAETAHEFPIGNAILCTDALCIYREDNKIHIIDYPNDGKKARHFYKDEIVLAKKETYETNKISGCRKRTIQAEIISAKGHGPSFQLDASKLSKGYFFQEYSQVTKRNVLQSDQAKNILYKVFCISGENNDTHAEAIYTQQGPSTDKKYYIYNDTLISLQHPNIPEFDKAKLISCINDYLSLCTDHGISFIMLALKFIGLLFELPDMMSPSDCRSLKPTYFVNIVGKSGVGKTTMVKAALEYDPSRYFALCTSTKASICQGIAGTFSNILIIDDLPPDERTGHNKQGIETMKYLLRVFGDIGADKKTAASNDSKARSWIVLVSEGYYLSVTSDILRTIPIFIKDNSINFDAATRLQSKRDTITELTITFLSWFFSQSHFDGKYYKSERLLQLQNDFYEKIRSTYKEDTPARLYDSHANLLAYCKLICDFLNYLDNNKETDNIMQNVHNTLQTSMSRQMTHIKESSLFYAVQSALADIINNGHIESFEFSSRSRKNLIMNISPEQCDGYLKGRILVLFSNQKKALFSRVREYNEEMKILDKDIKATIIENGLCYNIESQEISQGDVETRITTNIIRSRGQRVMVLMLPSHILNGGI